MSFISSFEQDSGSVLGFLARNPMAFIVILILSIFLFSNVMIELLTNIWVLSASLTLVGIFKGFKNKGEGILLFALIIGLVSFFAVLIPMIPSQELGSWGVFEFLKPALGGMILFIGNLTFVLTQVIPNIFTIFLPRLIVAFLELNFLSILYKFLTEEM